MHLFLGHPLSLLPPTSSTQTLFTNFSYCISSILFLYSFFFLTPRTFFWRLHIILCTILVTPCRMRWSWLVFCIASDVLYILMHFPLKNGRCSWTSRMFTAESFQRWFNQTQLKKSICLTCLQSAPTGTILLGRAATSLTPAAVSIIR